MCTKVFDEKPEVFVIRIDAIKNRIHEGIKDGRKSYWLEPKSYEEFKDNWETIGKGTLA